MPAHGASLPTIVAVLEELIDDSLVRSQEFRIEQPEGVCLRVELLRLMLHPTLRGVWSERVDLVRLDEADELLYPPCALTPPCERAFRFKPGILRRHGALEFEERPMRHAGVV